MIIHTEVAQGTQKWLDLRAGIPTASRFDEIVTPTGELSKSAPKYMQHLLAERIIGKPIDGFKSQWMEHGNDFEHKAIAAYEWERNVTTRKIGFVTTDDGRIGCSPDSFIDEDLRGMVEAKAPSPAVHVGYLLAADVHHTDGSVCTVVQRNVSVAGRDGLAPLGRYDPRRDTICGSPAATAGQPSCSRGGAR